ncbi:hypothetical protein [Nonomuraea ceibae]|uniref:hypothetical protein n=1 Tax=Nonomuraea ceibae TaxID=1935170 RepID=UPI001C5F810E|nr:hypothetical protein [Nonomuraea ceibae]
MVENGITRSSTTEGSGSGLAGLGERVRLLGGSFSSGRMPDGSFQVKATLPWQPAPPPISSNSVADDAPPARPVSGQMARLPMALVQAAGLATVVGLMGAALTFLPLPSRAAMIDIGMADGALRRALGVSEPIAELAVAAHEPPRPEGSRCWYFYAGYDITADPVRVVRYCLVGERIADKRLITVHMGRER